MVGWTQGIALLALAVGAVQAAAGDYAPVAEATKAQFTPVGDKELAATRSELAQRVIAAEQMLQPKTAQGAAWFDYLAWEGIQKQLAPGTAADLPAARETLRRLSSGAEGLEKQELQQVADAIEDYLGVAQFARVPADRQRLAFDQAIDALAGQLADPSNLDSALDSYKAEQSLGRLAGLEAVGRSGPFVERVRADFGHSNVYIEVQTPLLNRLVSRPVNECSPLQDCILGTRIQGTGATRGLLQVSTLPSLSSARLAFHLTGMTHSNTTGVNGPVKIYSVGDTSFQATQVVELSNESFRVLPASATATTRSRTQGIKKIGGGLGSRIIENIAKRRVAEKKGQANRIASGKAGGKIAARLDEQLTQQIVDGRRQYDERLTRPLRRRRATPRRLVQQTTSDALLVEAVLADDAQFAAAGPSAPAVPAPLSARLHQSALDNFLDALLGGASFSQAAIDAPVKANFVTPPWLKLEAPKAPPAEFKPWRLTLRRPRPVSVELSGGAAKVMVHAAAFESGDQTFKNWDIVVTYKPERIDGRWRMVRQGEVAVLLTGQDPTKPNRRRQRETYLPQRSVLAERLNQASGGLPRVIDIDPIDLSERDGPVSFLFMQGIQLDGGWLSTGWQAP